MKYFWQMTTHYPRIRSISLFLQQMKTSKGEGALGTETQDRLPDGLRGNSNLEPVIEAASLPDAIHPNAVGFLHANYDTGEQYWSPCLRTMLGIPLDAPPENHVLLTRIHPNDRRILALKTAEIWRPDCPSRLEFDLRIVNPGLVHRIRIALFTEFRTRRECRDAVCTFGLVTNVSEVDITWKVF
jgi:hypothetical protein